MRDDRWKMDDRSRRQEPPCLSDETGQGEGKREVLQVEQDL
jgi:hypothetical protein